MAVAYRSKPRIRERSVWRETKTSQRGSYKPYALSPVALTYPLLLTSQNCAAGLNLSAYRIRLCLLASFLRIFTRWCALKRRHCESFCGISLVMALPPDVIIQTRWAILLLFAVSNIGCKRISAHSLFALQISMFLQSFMFIRHFVFEQFVLKKKRTRRR